VGASDVNRGDIVRPWSHGAGSECSVLIYYSHNSHSLSNYSVDVALEVVDHGHLSLGYELSTRSTVHSIASVHSVLQKRCRIRYSRAPLALSWSFLYSLQESLLLDNLLVIIE